MITLLDDLSEPDRLGLFRNENYIVHRWEKGGACVYFSSTRQDLALAIHIAAEKTGKSRLREAVNDYIEASFREYDWCEVILGAVVPASVVNLAKNCGFEHIANALIGPKNEQGKIMARFRR